MPTLLPSVPICDLSFGHAVQPLNTGIDVVNEYSISLSSKHYERSKENCCGFYFVVSHDNIENYVWGVRTLKIW